MKRPYTFLVRCLGRAEYQTVFAEDAGEAADCLRDLLSSTCPYHFTLELIETPEDR